MPLDNRAGAPQAFCGADVSATAAGTFSSAFPYHSFVPSMLPTLSVSNHEVQQSQNCAWEPVSCTVRTEESQLCFIFVTCMIHCPEMKEWLKRGLIKPALLVFSSSSLSMREQISGAFVLIFRNLLLHQSDRTPRLTLSWQTRKRGAFSSPGPPATNTTVPSRVCAQCVFVQCVSSGWLHMEPKFKKKKPHHCLFY